MTQPNRLDKLKFMNDNMKNLRLDEKKTLARMLVFKEIQVKQNNNGCFCMSDIIDDNTLNSMFYFMKIKV
jgi:hypothetical protein